MVMFFFQALLYGSYVSQKDNITKHACDKEFQALKACIRQAVSFLSDWSGSFFFLCLISLDIMLDCTTNFNYHDKIVKRGGGQKCPVREWGDKKRKPLLFPTTHSLPYLSRVCFILNFVKYKYLLTGFSQDTQMFLDLKQKGTIRVK